MSKRYNCLRIRLLILRFPASSWARSRFNHTLSRYSSVVGRKIFYTLRNVLFMKSKLATLNYHKTDTNCWCFSSQCVSFQKPLSYVITIAFPKIFALALRKLAQACILDVLDIKPLKLIF